VLQLAFYMAFKHVSFPTKDHNTVPALKYALQNMFSFLEQK